MKEAEPLINSDFRSSSSDSFELPSSTVISIHNQGGSLIKYGSDVSTEEASQAPQLPVLRGITDMFLGVLFFAIMNLTMKFLIKDGFPVSQLMLFRSVTNSLGCMLYSYFSKLSGGAFGHSKDRIWLHLRGSLGAITLVTFFLSMKYLQLGDSVALSFISPVIMPIISSIWIGEEYSLLDAGAAIIAMTGIAFISKPEFLFGSDSPDDGSNGLGLFYAIIAGITGALSNVSIRKISKKSTAVHILNYMMLWILPVCLVMIYNEPGSVKFDVNYLQMAQFAVVGSVSAMGQFWFSRSLLTTPAKFVSPIMFTEVFYAYINQFVFWGILPTSNSTIGVILVAFSLLLIHCKV